MPAGEKTEAPTPKRVRDARKRGEVGKSQEIVSIGVLLTAVLGLRFFGPMLWTDLQTILSEGLANGTTTELTAESTRDLGRAGLASIVSTLLPLFAVLVLAAIAFNVGQTGLLLAGEKLKPKLSHLSPLKGAKRIVSPEGLVNLGKSLGKMGIVSAVVVLTMRSQIDEIALLGALTPTDATGRLFALAFDIALRSALVLFVLAALDWMWQRRSHTKRLRMTVQELKEENKDTDGDPQIRQAVRRRRQQLTNRMIAAVPDADVVVTNPTHVAVALRYDTLTMQAPIVVAKGERLVAQRIKAVARKAGVPVLEEPALARALNAAVEIGHPVPANLYTAVAEVLAWVYSLRSRLPWTRPTAAPSGAR